MEFKNIWAFLVATMVLVGATVDLKPGQCFLNLGTKEDKFLPFGDGTSCYLGAFKKTIAATYSKAKEDCQRLSPGPSFPVSLPAFSSRKELIETVEQLSQSITEPKWYAWLEGVKVQWDMYKANPSDFHICSLKFVPLDGDPKTANYSCLQLEVDNYDVIKPNGPKFKVNAISCAEGTKEPTRIICQARRNFEDVCSSPLEMIDPQKLLGLVNGGANAYGQSQRAKGGSDDNSKKGVDKDKVFPRDVNKRWWMKAAIIIFSAFMFVFSIILALICQAMYAKKKPAPRPQTIMSPAMAAAEKQAMRDADRGAKRGSSAEEVPLTAVSEADETGRDIVGQSGVSETSFNQKYELQYSEKFEQQVVKDRQPPLPRGEKRPEMETSYAGPSDGVSTGDDDVILSASRQYHSNDDNML